MPLTNYQKFVKGTYRELYNKSRWRKLAKDLLHRHPLCQVCLQKGIYSAAVEVDHVVAVSRMDVRLDNLPSVERFHNVQNLQTICKKCHKQKSDTEKKPITRWAAYDGAITKTH